MNKICWLFLLVFVFSLQSCLQYKEVQVVKVADLSIKEISPKGIAVQVAMQIKNPNNYTISIVDSDLLIFIEGKKMGTANIKETIKLAKKSNKIYNFTIVTNLKDLTSGAVPVLLGLITKSNINFKLQGDIKAKAKGIGKRFPVNFTKKITL